jgi:hypothetical protein
MKKFLDGLRQVKKQIEIGESVAEKQIGYLRNTSSLHCLPGAAM